jgi:hypothetical protein
MTIITMIDLDTLATITGGGPISRCIEGANFARRFLAPNYRLGLMSSRTYLDAIADTCVYAAKNPGWKTHF